MRSFVFVAYSLFFFFYCSGDPRDLHSFPTRRSSDLSPCRSIPTTIATVARRLTAALSRPTAEIEDDVADVHTLRRELRRLRAEVLCLEEDKRVLEERVAFLGRELEETRAKIPRGLSTS